MQEPKKPNVGYHGTPLLQLSVNQNGRKYMGHTHTICTQKANKKKRRSKQQQKKKMRLRPKQFSNYKC